MFEFKMPSMGADMESAILIAWNVKPGDTIKKGDIICEIETAKGDIDVEIWEAGTVTELLIEPGTRVPVGEPIARLDSGGGDVPREPKPVEPPPEVIREVPASNAPSRSVVPSTNVPASPAVRKRAAELHLDLTRVTGTGPGGAIKLADLEAAADPARHRASPVAKKMAADAGLDLDDVEATGAHDTVVKSDVERAISEKVNETDRHSSLRSAIAAAMSRSKREIPHYYLKSTIDVTDTLGWLKTQNSERSVKDRLVFGALAARAVALAASEVPSMNGFFEDETFRPSAEVHVGFAVAMRGGGVVAPAIHNVDQKSLDETMASIKNMVRRVRGGKLRSSEMTDPTITLTSLGELGVDSVWGVIYPPQVAIVGIGSPREAAVARDGMVGVHSLVDITLSADHRVSDGMSGAQFLKAVEKYLSEPEGL